MNLTVIGLNQNVFDFRLLLIFKKFYYLCHVHHSFIHVVCILCYIHACVTVLKKLLWITE